METNWTKMIEQYLSGELDATQRADFEKELVESAELRQELELHKLTHQIIERATLRDLVKQGGKTYVRLRQLKISALVLAVLLVVGAGIFYAVKSKSTTESAPIESIDEQVLKSMQTYLEFDNIAPEYFGFTGESDVFLSESGVLLSVTDASFLQDGKPYSGPAVIQWQEAQEAADIVKAGLSTMSGDKLLETQGMFSLKAFTPAGKPLDLSNSGVYVQVPVNENKEGMQLFQGVKGKDGQIDWQNPKPLERLPQAKAMQEMDLFPPDYEPKLNELKWFKEKEKRDSLYLSFDESTGSPKIEHSLNQTDIKLEDDLSHSSNKKSRTINPRFNNKGNVEISNPKYTFVDYPSANRRHFCTVGISRGENYQLQLAWGILDNDHARLLIFGHVNSNDQLLIQSTGDLFGLTGNYQNIKITELISEQEVVNGKVEVAAVYNVDLKKEGSLSDKATVYINRSDNKKMSQEIDISFEPKNLNEMDLGHPQKLKVHIPPSKVLAIWRPKFDGTILATRDFEKRMQAIHRTCNKKVFEVYTSNLNEPLWQKDECVAKMGYPEFNEFAAERVGAIKLNDKHAQNLVAFYASMTEILRNKGKRAVEAAIAKDRKWDEKIEKSRNKNEIQKGIREQLNLSQEYDFNLKDVCKQLGRKVGFQMHGGGTIVNIDKYVMDATIARKSTVITDPETGKTAKIEYEHFQVAVDDATKYNKLFVYLFPTEINSFQRLDLQNGALDYALNMHMSYTGMLIGMNDQGMFVYEFGKMQAKDYSKVVLKPISNQEFDQKMDALNKARNSQPASLKDELKWLFVEQKDYQVQKKRRENEQFRNTIRPTIYPCMTEAGGIHEADSI